MPAVVDLVGRRVGADEGADYLGVEVDEVVPAVEDIGAGAGLELVFAPCPSRSGSKIGSVLIQAPARREPEGSSTRFDCQADSGARAQATMDLDARGIVPRLWPSLLRPRITKRVVHALNDDGAPDGTSSGSQS
jgi:hypothetical protein